MAEPIEWIEGYGEALDHLAREYDEVLITEQDQVDQLHVEASVGNKTDRYKINTIGEITPREGVTHGN